MESLVERLVCSARIPLKMFCIQAAAFQILACLPMDGKSIDVRFFFVVNFLRRCVKLVALIVVRHDFYVFCYPILLHKRTEAITNKIAKNKKN